MLDKLPVVGFIVFVYGLLLIVIGQMLDIAHDSVFGVILGCLGFFVFVYGNMLLDELKQE